MSKDISPLQRAAAGRLFAQRMVMVMFAVGIAKRKDQYTQVVQDAAVKCIDQAIADLEAGVFQ